MPATKKRYDWFTFFLLAVLLVVTVAKYRGGPFPVDGLDAAMPYAGSRLWLAGENPYDAEGLRRSFVAGGGEGIDFNPQWIPPVYPPMTLALWSPLSVLPWHTALHVWVGLVVVLLVLAAAALLHVAGLRWWEPRALMLLLFVAVLAPLRSGLVIGQNAVPAVCLAAIGVAAIHARRDSLAGILLALSVCLKPHDGVLVVAYVALICRWRVLAWTGAGVAVIAMVALLRPGFSHLGWIPEWLHWVRAAGAAGGTNDPARVGLYRFQMIHLPVALHAFIRSRTLVNVLAYLVCGVIGLFALPAIVRKRERDHFLDLLELSVVLLVGLLGIFHRFPDAILLMFPLAWAASALATPKRGWAQGMLMLLLPFIVQVPDLLGRRWGHGPSAHASQLIWWQALLFPSLVWLLLLQLIWLTYALRNPKTQLARS